MPAGKLYIVITGIAAVPAKYNIAKAIAILQAINKFFVMNYFAP